MKKTIISHFYNEEYLLPFWLKHHSKMFDHGILIDYNSTDRSVDIIREICPTWEIIDSRNELFDAVLIDKEVEDIETRVDDWRICLNTTEFLVGDLNLLETIEYNEIYIKQIPMIDSDTEEFKELDTSKDLINQRYFGIDLLNAKLHLNRMENDPYLVTHRVSRLLSNHPNKYPPGRHYTEISMINEKLPFLILWYGFSPFNDSLINRRLQIQDRMPESDRNNGIGRQHVTNRETLVSTLKEHYQPLTEDLREMLKDYYSFENFGVIMKDKNDKYSSIQIRKDLKSEMAQYCMDNGYKLSGLIEKLIMTHLSGSNNIKK